VLVVRTLAKLEPGGAQLSLLRVSRALAARGHETRLLVGFATEPGVALARAHGIEPDLMDSPVDLQYRCDDAFAAWIAPRLDGADVVHAHMLGAWWATGRVIAHDVPFAASEHNRLVWPDEPQWGPMAEVAPRIERFYGHGPGARADGRRAGVDPERIVPGVSPVEGLGARERPGLPSPRIVFTGRLAHDKGPDVLVEAIALMGAPPPVVVCGAGPLEDALRARIAATRLGDVVRLEGWVEDPAGWVAGAAVQACPSREEGTSQAAALAMGLGVPVVAAAVDGLPQTVGEGRGLLVPPEDPAALAAALEDVLAGRRMPDLAAARAWALRLTPECVAGVYERDYLALARR
jgi:glycosyltransferase involved in cell wall biosynthesis